MKKSTLFLLLFFTCYIDAQVNTTGLIELSTEVGLEYSAKIDITDSEVTLTLIGPENRWLGLGFDAISMTSGKDVVIFDGTALTDRSFNGVGVIPPLDTNQDWSITGNTIDSGIRTLIATRERDTGNTDDFSFSTTDTSIDLVWARSRFEGFTLEWHGSNRGITTEALTLSTDSYKLNEFTISPNPGRNKLNIKLPLSDGVLKLEVYDVLGKRVYKGLITQLESSVNVTNWKSGVYLVKVSNNKIVQTKRFIKQ